MMGGVPAWVEDYVGLPFRPRGRDRDGIDCWGLVRLILDERFGVAMPSNDHLYFGTGRADLETLAAAVEAGLPACKLSPIEAGQERAGDVALMRIAGLPVHVGIVVAPGFVLHAEHGRETVLEDYRRPHLKPRIAGFWRAG